jgi:serine protease Do
MGVWSRVFVLIAALLIWGPVLAQEPKAWLGADVVDVTKAEADKLGWDAPHGAELGVVDSGSPADKVGLKAGDIILSIDGVEAETSADFEKVTAAKSPGAQVRLRVLSGGRERRVMVTLADRPKMQVVDTGERPQLLLDTGGHMALITVKA